ncbi:hypothetical protein HKX48_007124 [Thoreauomyces humboldtii]|nr:hypothetical protein HKX48_007124 [Thoreauomyces humboldtii]
MSTLLVLCLLLTQVPASQASAGDRDSIYLNCVQKCRFTSCRNGEHPPSMPILLRLTRWTCSENCEYECMHSVTRDTLAAGGKVQQFHGKWPFVRLFGMQEPASVAFSIANGFMHVRGLRDLTRRVPSLPRFTDLGPIRALYVVNAYIAIVAWTASAVFHSRDTPRTEKADYFFAILSILFGAYTAAYRAFRLHLRPAATSVALFIACVALYAAHVSYLSLSPSFDYGYNMVAGLSVGVASNFFWLTWFARNRRTRPYAWKGVLLVVLVTAATALEVLDFPPWRWIIDAHSLWHLATIPLIGLFYSFAVDDLGTEVRLAKGKQAR